MRILKKFLLRERDLTGLSALEGSTEKEETRRTIDSSSPWIWRKPID